MINFSRKNHTNIVFTVIGLIVTQFALSSPKTRCNKKQTRCKIRDTSFTVGDQVGFLDNKKRIVATGVVSKIRGKKRTVKITSRIAKISKKSNAILMEQEGFSLEKYGSYKSKDFWNRSWGASVGAGSFGLGEGSQVYELTGHWHLFSRKQVQLLLRGQYLQAEARIAKFATKPDPYQFKLTSFAGLFGLAYTFFQQNDISLRTEAATGLANIDASIDGSSDLVDGAGFDTGLQPGSTNVNRLEISGMYRQRSYELTAGAGLTRMHQANFPVFRLGANFPL